MESWKKVLLISGLSIVIAGAAYCAGAPGLDFETGESDNIH